MRSWEAVVEGALKRRTASRPFYEKEERKLARRLQLLGLSFVVGRWMPVLERGRVGLGDEENKLKERSLNWVLAGGSDLSDAGWLSAVARAALGTRSKTLLSLRFFASSRVFPGGSFIQVEFAFVQAQPLQVYP